MNKSDREIIDQFVGQSAGVRLMDPGDSEASNEHQLVNFHKNKAYPINAAAVLIWNYCSESKRVAELIKQLECDFPRVDDMENHVIDLIKALYTHGLVRLSKDKFSEARFALDYTPAQGQRSEKAERLVEFCLGNFASSPIPPFKHDPAYLDNEYIAMLEVEPDGVRLSQASGLSRIGNLDQKRIIDALISQRTHIPSGFKCWLVRGDSFGAQSDPDKGLHITGMRHAGSRNLVLLPTANRGRYLGPNLKNQMSKLKESWVHWDEKEDAAWWGGALTGDWWVDLKPDLITRRQVLEFYRDHPSDKVQLNLTEIPPGMKELPGVGINPSFTKRQAFANKCLVLLPGHDIASGLSWYFGGNSVVLMPNPHLEHILYFEIEPWTHYVPLESDPGDILHKLDWVLCNPKKAREIVTNAHHRLKWLTGPEYQWACNEVLRRISDHES